MPRTLLSLGSNLGDTDATLAAAEESLKQISDSVELRVSKPVVSTAVGGPEGQPDYRNSVVLLETQLAPLELLRALQSIEATLGRCRETRWAARTLDLDVLLYDQQIIATEELRVPHPRMTFRSFVLRPACEIAADWVHPECGQTLEDLHRCWESGRNAVRIAGDHDRRITEWLESSPWRAVERDHDSLTGPSTRLTIDARSERPTGPNRGPRLALVDCPAEHWQQEVEAAMQCVWPQRSPDVREP